jgi:hypothetical protein
MVDWIQSHEVVLWWLAALSIATFVASLVLVPLLIVRLPADYFSGSRRHRTPWAEQHPVVRTVLRAGKNVLGAIFALAGVAMLVLPGQGILTILIGIVLVDFPGKYGLERWIVSRGTVLRSMNWLRRRAGRAPLVID